MIAELELAEVIAFAVKAATAPLVAEIAELKTAQAVPGPPGPPGEKGADGAEGKPGRDGRDGFGITGEKGIDGTNGINGTNGVDGMGFDDLQVEHDGERAFTVKFVQGERVKTLGPFTIPCVIYRGVYQSGHEYEKGDSVTWGGSQWIASASTTSKPGDAGSDSRAWTLATKKGADGRNGKDAPGFTTVKV